MSPRARRSSSSKREPYPAGRTRPAVHSHEQDASFMTQSRLRPLAATRTPAFTWSPQPHARTLSLPEQIASSVGNAIIEGTYEAGKRILEQQLAADFQVSRGPVREALRILEREGLIRLQARRGAQVAQFDAEELRQIFQVRASLIGLAARLATELQNKAYIARL